MTAGRSNRESHICIKISPSEAHEAEYVPSVPFLWNLLFSLPLLIQQATDSFASQYTDSSIPRILKLLLDLGYSSLVPASLNLQRA